MARVCTMPVTATKAGGTHTGMHSCSPKFKKRYDDIVLYTSYLTLDKKSKLKPPKSPFLSPRFGRKKSSSSLKSPPPSVEELNACLRSTPSPVTLTHTPTLTPRGTPVNTGVDIEQDGNRRPQHKDRSSDIATGPGMSPAVTPTFGRRGIKDNR